MAHPGGFRHRAAALLQLLLPLLALLAIAAQAGDRRELRLVSLSPAISRTLATLGLADRVVGRTPWCRLPAAIPVVGDLYRIDYERLIRVRPTDVLLQTPASGLDPELRRLAKVHRWRLHAWPHLDRVTDVRRLIRELPEALFGGAPPTGVAARRDRLLQALDTTLKSGPCTTDPGPVVLLTGTDPPLAFGRRTYLDDLLQAWGLRNAVQQDGWVTLSLERLARLRPATVVWLSDRPAEPPAGLRAAAPEHLRVLEHPDVLLPAAGLPDVAQALARILSTLPGCRSTRTAASPP